MRNRLLVGIVGRMTSEQWTDRNTGEVRSKPLVKAERLALLGSRNATSPSETAPTGGAAPAGPSARTMSPEATAQGSGRRSRSPACLWISTGEASAQLGISRKTLFRLKKRGLLKQQHHWARKNPASRSSDLLWHVQRCEMALGRL